jgi:chitinase
VNKTGQLTVFWGRHKEEGSLRESCDSGMYTMIIIMSFLDVYGHGKYRLDLSRYTLGGMGDDIKHCQNLGVLVSLAVGGDYSLPTKQSAVDLVDYLWNAYWVVAPQRLASISRPFGGAWLDVRHRP